MKITESAFLSALSYDPDTGWFTWKISIPGRWKIKAGDRAGTSLKGKCGKRYRRLHYKGEHVSEHRMAFLFMEGRMPAESEEVDHENGDGEDNRWLNIVISTRKKNSKNLRKRADNSSGVTGVSWCSDRNKWMAHIHVDGMMKNLGRLDDFNKAVEIRKNAEVSFEFHKNHGDNRPL